MSKQLRREEHLVTSIHTRMIDGQWKSDAKVAAMQRKVTKAKQKAGSAKADAMVNGDKLVDAANRKERRAIRRALKEEKSAIDAANKRARADEKRDSKAMAKRLAAGDV